MKTPARILVVRTDRLGDVLLSLPVLGGLRQRLPEAHLTLWTQPALAPLLTGHPWIDALLDAPIKRPTGRLATDLRAGGYDCAVVLKPAWRVAAAVRLAGIPLRVGTAYRLYSAAAFNRRVRVHRRRSGLHEMELNLRVADAVAGSLPRLAPWLPVPPAARQAAGDLLGVGSRPAVLHPGSGGSAREWSAAAFRQLAERLRADGVPLVVTGVATEAPLVEAVAGGIPGALALAGSTSLPVLAGVLERAGVVVGASTGPMHLAAAVGTPTVALFPPIAAAAPARWRPIGPGVVLEAQAPTCPRCIHEACPYWDCMATIPVATVHARTLDLLRQVPDGALP